MDIGDVIQHVVTGRRRVITSITPAGAFGTAVSEGPTYHAAVAGNGSNVAVHRGHSVAIWSRSMSYPTREWRVVDTAR